MSIIQTNVQSLLAQQALTLNARRVNGSMAELATGLRIRSSADDAAGLAMGNKLGTRVISLAQAVRNAGDGISMMQTADGAAEEITHMLVRMKELAVQAGNGTHSAVDRTALNTEFTQLRAQINQVTRGTQWNGMKLIGGDKATVAFQVGVDASDTVHVVFRNLWASGVASGVSGANILTNSSVGSALSGIDQALQAVDDFRAGLGARMNRLAYASDNALNVLTRTEASRSRVMDADYAKSTSELARAQIVQQAGMAMLSQANQLPRLVTMLLR